MLLHYSDMSSLRIYMTSLTLEPNCRTDKDTRLATAESDDNNLSCSQRDYTLQLIFANADTLESRREQLTERFLRKSSCLHYLLPDKWDSIITDRLHHPKTFKPMLMKTEKFRKSFVPYCLKHYDQHSWCKLCITYKLLSQTLDISARFFQHFAILLYIVLIQFFCCQNK